jgi:hypothetical protein
MAVIVKTISVGLRVFGNSPTEKFASANTRSDCLVYGSDKWGASGNGVPVILYKGIQDSSFSVSSTVNKVFSKWVTDTAYPTSTVGKVVFKVLPDALPVTNTLGKSVLKNVISTMPITTTIGKNVVKDIFETPILSSTIARNLVKYITNTLDVITQPTVNRYRNGWADALDGETDLISWPKPSSLSATTAITTTWIESATVSTTWS